MKNEREKFFTLYSKYTLLDLNSGFKTPNKVGRLLSDALAKNDIVVITRNNILREVF